MASTDLRIELLTNLGAHRPAWDHLVASQPVPSPFLRSWWVEHAADGALMILACFDGSDLVGGAAFEVENRCLGPACLEIVRCVGQGVLGPDHLDLVSTPRHRADVARAVLSWLRRPGSRVVDLDGLAATGSLASLFADHEVDRLAAPFADLTAGAEQYLASRPGRVRSTLKRTSKRLAGSGVEVVSVGGDGIDEALAVLARLHDDRWAGDSVFLQGWDRFCAVARAGAALGEVVVHELRDFRGEVLAVELDLVLGGCVAFYQAGRRTEREWRGCGSLLRARIIESAAMSGAHQYDLLRGDEAYKADWATGRRELVRVTMGVGVLGAVALRGRSLRQPLVRRNRPEQVELSP